MSMYTDPAAGTRGPEKWPVGQDAESEGEKGDRDKKGQGAETGQSQVTQNLLRHFLNFEL